MDNFYNLIVIFQPLNNTNNNNITITTITTMIITGTSELRVWDSIFTMKHGVQEVVSSIHNRGKILEEFFFLPGYLVRLSL